MADNRNAPRFKRFADLASALWHDMKHRDWLQKKFNISTTSIRAFEDDLKQKALDPRRWDDPEYWEDFLEDLNDQMRGGTKKDRDDWFEWSGPEFRPFRNWVHREKKPCLPIDEQKKPFTRPQIQEWWDEWKQLSPGKQAQYEIAEPIE